MGFSRQEYWGGLPFPSPGDLPYTGLLHCRQILYHLSHLIEINNYQTWLFFVDKQFDKTSQALLKFGVIMSSWSCQWQINVDWLFSPLSPSKLPIKLLATSSFFWMGRETDGEVGSHMLKMIIQSLSWVSEYVKQNTSLLGYCPRFLCKQERHFYCLALCKFESD